MSANATPVRGPAWNATGITSWITTVDHKRIGILYIATSLAFFAAGGILALLIRTQLIAANVDMVWLATLICVNLQTSFLTPPFGWALFFLRGVAPPEITTGDIYRGIVPFVAMQIIALVLCFFFPALALWLPKTIGW